MGIFTKRLKPDDAISRISNAMDEIMSLRRLLDATPKEEEYKSDWEANREYAHKHLLDAWSSLGAALTGLQGLQHRPTRAEESLANHATVEMQQRELQALRVENRWEDAWRLAQACTATTAMAAAQHALRVKSRLGDALRLAQVRAATTAMVAAQHALRVKSRLEDAWRLAQVRAMTTAMVATQNAQLQIQDGEPLAHKLRRAVMGAVHPDKAADAAEREWRTRICQTLFPEIDRVMKGP